MTYIIRIEGHHSGHRTSFDGQYLTAYDPDTPGHDPNGVPMIATVLTTPDISLALRFESMESARECYMRTAKPPYNIRLDGSPSRPLTAFSISISSFEPEAN